MGWRIFFPVVTLCQLFGSCGIIFDVTYVLTVQYICAVMSVFLFHQEKVFGVTYVLRVLQMCGCVSFLVVAGNRSQNASTRNQTLISCPQVLRKMLIGFLSFRETTC